MAQKRKTNQADLIELFDRIVRAGDDDDDDEITLPRHLLVAIADLLKRLPMTRGRQVISGRARVHESLVIMQALRREAQLIAQGIPNKRAIHQAAEEAAPRLDRGLAVSTIKRMMSRRRNK